MTAKQTAKADVTAVHSSYPLRTVSKLTGLSADVIRVWERRYGVVNPKRGPRGARLYTNEEIAHLQRLASLVEQGRAIGDIAGLDRDALEALIADAAADPATPSGAGAFTATFSAGAASADQSGTSLSVRFFDAIESFDMDTASSLLADAAISVGVSTFLTNIITPLLTEVGDRWADGRLSIAKEHMVSKVMRDFLGAFARARRVTGPPCVLLATPPGERHELGVTVAGTMLLEKGIPILALGADLPSADIVATTLEVHPQAVALSVVTAENRKASIESIREIEASIPDDIMIWLGGNDRQAVLRELGATRVRTVEDLDAFARAVLVHT